MYKTSYDGPQTLIWIIDDDLIQIRLYKHYLKNVLDSHLFQVVYFINAEETYDKLTNTDPLPDIIFCDLFFLGQKMSGMDFFKSVKNNIDEKITQIPIVITSAYDFDSLRQISEKYGIKDILQKPIEVEKIINKINAVQKKL